MMDLIRRLPMIPTILVLLGLMISLNGLAIWLRGRLERKL